MKTGAAISGGAHVALIVAAIIGGEFVSRGEALPAPIAEVTLMTGAEFQAALSAAPDFDAALPPSPAAPDEAEERADVEIAETDAAPTTRADPSNPEAPAQGEEVTTPSEEVVTARVANVGDQLASPLAPEGEELVALAEPADEAAPIAETPRIQAPPPPSARPSSPAIDTSTPEPPAPNDPEPQDAVAPPPEPEPQPEPEPEVVEQPLPEPTPEPEPEVAEQPQPEEVPEKLNDPDIPAPALSPPPPTKPREIAEAKEAERKKREAAQAQETGATRQAEAPQGGGTTRTVGKVSYRDRESLRIGIQSFYRVPPGLQGERELSVTLRIELSRDGKIVSGPRKTASAGPTRGQRAVEGAGHRALKQAEGRGVFRRLPADKYDAWKIINVTFTATELRVL